MVLPKVVQVTLDPELRILLAQAKTADARASLSKLVLEAAKKGFVASSDEERLETLTTSLSEDEDYEDLAR